MATIVIELDDNLKALEAPFREMAEAVHRSILAARDERRSVDYGRTEQQFAEQAARIEAAAHQLALQALDIDEPYLLIGGRVHVQVLKTPGTFKTMAGPVPVEKHSRYRPLGERNAPTVDVISMRVGAVGDGWLPATAKAMAHAIQQSTSRDAAAHAACTFRLPYSRCAFEDVGHEVGRQVVEVREMLEDALIERFVVPAEARSISVSLDRVTVPMEEPRKRPVGRPRKRAPKKPIERVFRMGYVGTVSLHDEKGDALHTIRHARMPAGDVPSLMRSLVADVRALLTARADLRVLAVADGAPELWNLLGTHITEEGLGVPVLHLIDFWHVTEKLGAALRVMHDGDGELARWKMLLLNRADAVETILGELRASGKERRRVGDARPVHEAITYLENGGHLMGYTMAKRRGLPIGSGIAEAACKSLFEVRMKRPGARWKNETGDHVLHLRALALSDRWDDGVRLTLGRLRQPVRRAAA